MGCWRCSAGPTIWTSRRCCATAFSWPSRDSWVSRGHPHERRRPGCSLARESGTWSSPGRRFSCGAWSRGPTGGRSPLAHSRAARALQQRLALVSPAGLDRPRGGQRVLHPQATGVAGSSAGPGGRRSLTTSGRCGEGAPGDGGEGASGDSRTSASGNGRGAQEPAGGGLVPLPHARAAPLASRATSLSREGFPAHPLEIPQVGEVALPLGVGGVLEGELRGIRVRVEQFVAQGDDLGAGRRGTTVG